MNNIRFYLDYKKQVISNQDYMGHQLGRGKNQIKSNKEPDATPKGKGGNKTMSFVSNFIHQLGTGKTATNWTNLHLIDMNDVSHFANKCDNAKIQYDNNDIARTKIMELSNACIAFDKMYVKDQTTPANKYGISICLPNEVNILIHTTNIIEFLSKELEKDFYVKNRIYNIDYLLNCLVQQLGFALNNRLKVISDLSKEYIEKIDCMKQKS